MWWTTLSVLNFQDCQVFCGVHILQSSAVLYLLGKETMQAYSYTLWTWYSAKHTFWITPKHTALFAFIVTFLFSSIDLNYIYSISYRSVYFYRSSYSTFPETTQNNVVLELHGLWLARCCVICLIFGCYPVSRQPNIRHIPTESGTLSSHWSISPKPNLPTLCGLDFHSFIHSF